MAESNFKPGTSEDQSIECPVCNDDFTQAKLLPCNHTFCLECISNWSRLGPDQGFVTCPVCRGEFSVPPDGLQALPADIFIENLIDRINLRRLTNLRESDTEPFAKLCPLHVEEVQAFCTDCSEFICSKCRSHEKHEYRRIETALNSFKRSIQNDILRIECSLNLQQKASSNLQETKQLMLRRLEETNTAIYDASEAIQRRVDKERDNLLKTVESFKTESSEKWQSSKDEVDEQITIISSFLESVNHLVTRNDPVVLSTVFREGRRLANRLEDSECDIGAHYRRLSAEIIFVKHDFLRYLPVIVRENFVGRLYFEENQTAEGVLNRELPSTWEELRAELNSTARNYEKKLQEARETTEQTALKFQKKEIALADKERALLKREAKLNNRLKNLEERNQALDEHLTLANNRCCEIQQRLDGENKAIKILLNESTRKFNKLKEENETTELLLSKCRKELQALKNERVKATESTAVARRRIQELEDELKSKMKSTTKLTRQLLKLKKDNKQWSMFYNECKYEFKRLPGEHLGSRCLFKLKQEFDKLKSNNEHWCVFFKATKHEFQKLHNELSRTTDSLQKSTQEFLTYKEETNKALDNSRRELQKLDEEINKKTTAISILELENEQLRNENFHTRMSYNELFGLGAIYIVLYLSLRSLLASVVY